MDDKPKNPYVILGVDFGCSLDEAKRGFVQAVRRVRSAESPPFSEDDVTWALHQIEHAESDHSGVVEIYRIPANPSLFESASAGLFVPPAVPLERQTGPLDDEELARLGKGALAEALRAYGSDLATSIELPSPYEGGVDARL